MNQDRQYNISIPDSALQFHEILAYIDIKVAK